MLALPGLVGSYCGPIAFVSTCGRFIVERSVAAAAYTYTYTGGETSRGGMALIEVYIWFERMDCRTCG